jgi:Ca2+-transporting ATPase
VPLIGALRGRPWREMLLTGLTLAFATIPEELPILVVVVLGLGSQRLARQGAIVRRLIAAETLGATTLICTDKTGTLTENRMTLTAVILSSAVLQGENRSADDEEQVKHLARLASEPPAGNGARFVDPIDLAVWKASTSSPGATVRFSFDSRRRLASGLARLNGHQELGVKGAPEVILDRATEWRLPKGVRPLDGRG